MLHTLTRTPPNPTGPTLVFLHYYGGSGQSWTAVADQLAINFRCLLVDLPGFGESPPLSDHQTVDQVADQVATAIREQVGDGPFVLVGHSMGGKIALAIAAGTSGSGTLPPAELRGLVLLAPSPPVPEPIPDADRQEMLDQPSLPPGDQRNAAKKTADTITHVPVSDAIREQIITDNLRSSPEAWIAWLNVGSREDISDQMGRIHVPIAILAGDQDKALPHSVQTDSVLPYLPQASLQIVSGAGHLLSLEVPDVVVTAIRAICSKLG